MLAVAIAGCSSSSNMNASPPPPPPPPPAPPPPPPPTGRLYVGLDDLPGSILVYNLPLTNGAAPTTTVAHDANNGMTVNSTTLAVTDIENYSVAFYTLPLTSASAPYATWLQGNLASPLFVSSGALYYGATNMINVYTPPFTSTSTPSSHIATAGFSFARMAVDPSGHVYQIAGNVISVVYNGVLTTTLTATPGTEFRAPAASATQLFVCETNGSANHVYVYALPLTSTSTPTLIMNPNTDAPSDCALDSSGNLYIASAHTVALFAPPFTTSSHSTVGITLQGGAGAMAIGQ
jgi:hypothetical protein